MTTRFRTNNPWIVLLVLCAGFFMIVLDLTVVTIATPNIITDLQASLDQVLWVLNGYIVVYAVLLITAGRLGDYYGQRNIFALGLAVFTAASAYCGLAPDISHLQAARVVQGIGGALLTPQTLAILTSIFPADRRGAAFGIWGGVAGIASVAGPTLGGFLVTGWNWRSIFYMNIPIGIVALVATFLVIPDLRSGRRHHMDILGVALATAGLFAIVFALVEGQRFNWGNIAGPVSIPSLLVAGTVVLAVFIIWERSQTEPLMPLSLFRNRNFSLLNGIGVAVSFSLIGLFLAMVIYLQSSLKMSPLEAGLTTAPSSIVSMLVAPVAGRLADKLGGKYLLMVGLLIYAGGTAWLIGSLGPGATAWSFVPAFSVLGLGMGLVFSPMVTVAMRNVTPDMAGAASGVFNSLRQLGSVLGGSIIGAILQAEASRPPAEGLRVALGVPVAVLLVAAVSTLFIQRRKPAAQERPAEALALAS